MNLGLEAPVQLPFLIVHLTQDHVVLQEKLVSHTEPAKQTELTGFSTHRSFGTMILLLKERIRCLERRATRAGWG